jgi:hypothetical protein
MIAIYSVDLGFDRLEIRADLVQAAAKIFYRGADDEWVHTPYQTADASHDERLALGLVIAYLGRDYFAQPNDKRESAAIIAALLDSADIERRKEDPE